MSLFLSQGMLNTTYSTTGQPEASLRQQGKPPAPSGCPGTTGSHSFAALREQKSESSL